MIIDQVSDAQIEEVLQFLNEHEETAQFLITNLKAQGPFLRDHHNSGNFKVIRRKNKIVAVYCLSKRGNLIFQGAGDVPAQAIIADCQREPHPLKSFIGDWNSIEPIYETYKELHPDYKPTYFSKEILYIYELKADDESLVHDSRVRLLEFVDFDQWIEQSFAYNKEMNVPSDLSREVVKKDFKIKTSKKVWWGMFEGEKLLSRTALNSNGDQIGQVGGVFTSKPLRKRGYSKSTMLHMLRDCIEIHGHKKSILFTGESDRPAQKLYESIGYERAGYFGLILS